MKVLVTGAAGFIGFHTATRLLNEGHQVIGLDNLNDYYDVGLKRARLALLQAHENFTFRMIDLADRQAMSSLFITDRPQRIVHLAAQAGVRYSIENPHAYVDANIVGFLNVLEGCRDIAAEHLVYASTSSVYGANTSMPFRVEDSANHPLTLYAATKKSNELMAHAYASLFNLPMTGLRFFTVYGPWGRPDMALFKFTRAILADEPIDVFNNGHHQRDFTYVSDIVDGIVRATSHAAKPDPTWSGDQPNPATSQAPYRLYNIGASAPVSLLHYINCIERVLGKQAKMNMLPMQLGDVPDTFADIDRLKQDVGYEPKVSVDEGVANFVRWYREYYRV